MIEELLTLIYITVMIVFLFLGIRLLLQARKGNFRQLSYLGGQFISVVLLYLTAFFEETLLNQIQNQLLKFIIQLHIPDLLVSLFGILFLKQGFYTDKESPTKFFMAFLTLLSIFDIIKVIKIDNLLISIIYLTINTLGLSILFLWQAFIGLKTYNKIREDPIEPYIKMKFLLFSIAGILMALSLLIGFIGIIPAINQGVLTLLTTIFDIFYAIICYLLWVMPEWLKVKLNGTYTEKVNEIMLSEEEIMNRMEGVLSE
jgi:hypothetical protein